MEAVAATPESGFLATTLSIQTSRTHDFVDITNNVANLVAQSGITNGLVTIASRHTTAAIIVNENEPQLLEDLDRFLHELAPEEQHYGHNGAPCPPGEHPNGHAHCQALLLNTSVSLPVVEGDLVLGRYQRIFLLELDRARPREATVVAIGS